MPSGATCGPSFCAGGANSLHGALAPELGIGDACRRGSTESRSAGPARGAWFSSSGGASSPSMSRPLSVNHSSFVRGCQSKPTELRTPRAKTSSPVPSGFIRVMFGVAIGIRLADVARRADRHVQLAVRAEGDELPAVVAVGREAVGDDDRRRRIGEAALDVVEAQDAVDRRHVERAVAERDARRLAQSRRDDADDRLALRRRRRQRDRVDLARRRASRRTACRPRPRSSRAHSARARRPRSRTRAAAGCVSSGKRSRCAIARRAHIVAQPASRRPRDAHVRNAFDDADLRVMRLPRRDSPHAGIARTTTRDAHPGAWQRPRDPTDLTALVPPAYPAPLPIARRVRAQETPP